MADTERKLEAVRLLLSPDVAERLFGRSGVEPAEAAAVDMPTTDLILHVLREEAGGRDSGWFRHRLAEYPRVAAMMKGNPNILNTSLSRLHQRGLLVRVGRLYYLPATKQRIDDGEIEDDAPGGEPKIPFARRMHQLMAAAGGPFTAGDAVALARADAEIGEAVRAKPTTVYSWLGREVQKGRLLKSGGHYRYPLQREEAPDGNAASASFAGRAATLPFENQSRREA